MSARVSGNDRPSSQLCKLEMSMDLVELCAALACFLDEVVEGGVRMVKASIGKGGRVHQYQGHCMRHKYSHC